MEDTTPNSGIDYERVGRRIAEHRRYIKKLSQNAMAQDLLMHQSDISDLERARPGSGINNLDKLKLIADYLGISMQTLLFGSDHDPKFPAYTGDKTKITLLDPQKKGNQKHYPLLAKTVGTELKHIQPVIYRYENCLIYLVMEHITSFQHNGRIRYDRPHFYVVYNDEVIASAVVSRVAVFDLVLKPSLEAFKKSINANILDVFDLYRHMDPYYILWKYTEEEPEKESYVNQSLHRMSQLNQIAEYDAALFVEQLYVLEDRRKKGVCRLLLDVMTKYYPDASILLNLEPSSDMGLYSNTYYPACTVSDVGQMSFNAAIAEKLGFIIDDVSCPRKIVTVDADGNRAQKVVSVHKSAYRLSEKIQKLIQNDGDLVALGRAKERMALHKYRIDEHNTASFSVEELDGKMVAEVFLQENGETTSVFAVAEDLFTNRYGVARERIFSYGLNVPTIEEYYSIGEAKNSKYYDFLNLTRMALLPAFKSEMKAYSETHGGARGILEPLIK